MKILRILLCIFIIGSVFSGCTASPAENPVVSSTATPTQADATPKPTEAVSNPDIIPLPESVQGKDYWSGKKIAFLGDSITELNGFQAHVKQILGAGTIYSHGRSGTTIAGQGESFTVRSAKIEKDTDLIFVFGGTNDFHNGIPLGTIDDPASTTTFYGAVRMLCMQLEKRYPDTLVVFATPLQRTLPPMTGTDGKNGQGLELTAYVDAIIDVCKVYEIPVLDFYRTSAITTETAATYLYDGIHPNAEGFLVLANEITAYLCP